MPHGYDYIKGFSGKSGRKPSSHELAKLLLSVPDMPVAYRGLVKRVWVREVAIGTLNPQGERVFVIQLTDSEEA